jgi:hypothetical protein
MLQAGRAGDNTENPLRVERGQHGYADDMSTVRKAFAAIAIVAALGFAACGEDDVKRNVNDKADEAKQKLSEAKKKAEEAKKKAEDAAQDVQDAVP